MTEHPIPPFVRRLVRTRRGAALLLALFALIVLATIVSGSMFVSQQEYRGSRNTLIEQRAFAIAEYGLNSEVSNWDRSRNLPPPTGMGVGAFDTTRIYIASGDSARVSIKRLSDNVFWVVSEGRANIGAAVLESARQTSAFVRIAYPSIRAKGAITSAGNVGLIGNATVIGYDTDPTGWTQCASIPSDTVPAVVVAPGANVSIAGSAQTSVPAVAYDSAAADSNTYVRYGSESWNSLTSNADIKLSGGTINSIQPALDLSLRCDYSLTKNWGEPNRPGVSPCYGYFPIIYSSSSLTVTGNGRGQGILLVNGDFRIQGNFDFYGLVVARDDVIKGAGTAKIQGAVFSANMNFADSTSTITGTHDVLYSRCALESALRASAILIRAKERHWAQIF
jgi:hypothetical protein